MDAWLIGLSIGFMVLTVAGVWWPDALLKNNFLNDTALASVLILGQRGLHATCFGENSGSARGQTRVGRVGI
jgi:hypothetical protein